MLLLRSHLKIPSSAMVGVGTVPAADQGNVSSPSAEVSNASQITDTQPESQSAEVAAQSQDDEAASSVENMEQSDQSTDAKSESEN
jgi:hypothetical protein